MAAEADDLAGVRRRGRAPTGSPTPCCSAWAARASAPEVFRAARSATARLRLHVLDSTHPDQIRAVARRASTSTRRSSSSPRSPAGRSRRCRSSSTSTALQPRRRALRRRHRPGHLAREARRRARLPARVRERPGHRRALLARCRYFGLVPAALAGYDVGAVLDSAQAAMPRTASAEQGNPGLWLGAALGELALRGPRQADLRRRRAARVVRPVGRAARRRVDRQAGPRHPADRRRAAVDARRLRRRPRVPARRDVGDADDAARLGALEAAGHPVIHARRRRARPTSAAIFFLSEFATAVAGWALGINPFDQPNVQEAKDNTKRVLDEGSPEPRGRRPRASCSAASSRPRYLAIMAYLPYSGRDRGGRRARCASASSASTTSATTFGYGPRFLHSTGQFHKGGPKVGRFLQLVDEPHGGPRDPGRAVHVRHADPGAGRRRPADAAHHGLAAVRVAVGDIDAIKEQL